MGVQRELGGRARAGFRGEVGGWSGGWVEEVWREVRGVRPAQCNVAATLETEVQSTLTWGQVPNSSCVEKRSSRLPNKCSEGAATLRPATSTPKAAGSKLKGGPQRLMYTRSSGCCIATSAARSEPSDTPPSPRTAPARNNCSTRPRLERSSASEPSPQSQCGVA